MELTLRALIAIVLPLGVTGLICHQCNGWHGWYPPSISAVSTCDLRNNDCESTQFCVKIVDTMRPGTHYVTYKADCYFQTTLQVNPTNLTYVTNRNCYPFQDGAVPPRRWWYCFCNDRDYCNATQNVISALALVLPLLRFLNT